MKTFYEIVGGKNYRQLSAEERDLIQDRQTFLVNAWQDNTDPQVRWPIEDELLASFRGLVKGMAYRQAEKSFSVEQEDFEGIINLALAETLVKFDRTYGKPFQPVFLTKVKHDILMMYREKGYDLHDTTDRLDELTKTKDLSMAETISTPSDAISDVETAVITDQMLTKLFGNDEKRKTIIRMYINKFKRNEIVSVVSEEGKTKDATIRMVNRTWSDFKKNYLALP